MATKPVKRSGSSGNQGLSYELKVISYFALKFTDVNSGIEDFEILENLEGYGKFDDIILKIKKTNGERCMFLFQLKHFSKDGLERNKALTSKNFHDKQRNQKNQSFCFDLKSACKLDIDGIDSSNVKFVLYTNKSKDDEEPNFNLQEPEDINMIKIGGQAFSITNYESDVKEENFSTFIKMFIVLSGQPNEEDMDHLISELFQQMFHFNSETVKLVLPTYMKYIENWKNGYCGGTSPLFKDQIQFKLTEIVTCSYLKNFKFTFNPFYVPDFDNFKEIALSYDIVLIENNGCETQLEESFTYVSYYIRSLLDEYQTVTITKWNDVVSLSEIKNLYEKIPNAKQEMDKLWGNATVNKTITFQQLYFYLWRLNMVPLVLHFNNEEIVNMFSFLLRFKTNRLIIFNESCIAMEIDTIKYLKTEMNTHVLKSYEDLNLRAKEFILNQFITFQGRSTTARHVFTDDRLSSKLLVPDIIQIIQGTFEIGETIHKLPKFLVPQSLNSICVKSELFAKYPKFMISGHQDLLLKYSEDLKVDNVKFQYLSEVYENPPTYGTWKQSLNLHTAVDCRILLNDALCSVAEIMETIDNENLNIEYKFVELTTINAQIVTKPTNFVQHVYVIFCLEDELFRLYLKQNNILFESYEIQNFADIHINLVPITCKYIISNEIDIDVSGLRMQEISCHFFKLCFIKQILSLEYLGSFGNSDTIRMFIDSDVNLETEYDLQFCFKYNNLNVITGCPGMGKSVLLNYTISICPPEYLPILINCNQNFHYFVELSTDDVNTVPVLKEFLLKNTQKIDDSFLETYIDKKRIALFFDGFDEIISNSENAITAILQHFLNEGFMLFVTTRSVKVEKLLVTLNSVSRSIIPFNYSDQKLYLEHCFMSRLPNKGRAIQKFVSKLLSATNSQAAWDMEFSGVPIQTALIAEIYFKECEKYCNDKEMAYGEFLINKIDAVSLYEKFFNLKINYLKEKDNTANSKHEKYIEKIIKDSIEDHKYLAMKAIFSVDVPNANLHNIIAEVREGSYKIGLIDTFLEDDTPVFVHRTFAEYLSALYISDNFKQDFINELFSKILGNSAYDVVRQILDRLLTNNCPLHRAVLNNDKAEFLELLRHHFELLNKLDTAGRNILHIAMSWGTRHSIPRINSLQKLSSFQNYCEDFKQELNAIYLNCRGKEGYTSFVELILTKAPESMLFQKDEIVNCSPLEYAFKVLTLENVNVYLKYFRSINKDFNKLKFSFLQICNYKKHPHVPDLYYYRELLFVAAMYDFSDFAYAVMQLSPFYFKKYNVTYGENEISLLHFAATRNSDKTIDYLIKRGTSVNLLEVGCKKSPLHFAADFGHLSTVQLLITKQANVLLKDYIGKTPLYYALDKSDEITKILSELELNVGGEKRKADQLFSASQFGNLSLVTSLLHSGLNPNLPRNKYNNTPLTYASQNGDLKIVRLLIQKGAHINDVNHFEETALICASVRGHTEIVKFLLENDADFNISDRKKKTALQHAKDYNKSKIIQLLEEHGARE